MKPPNRPRYHNGRFRKSACSGRCFASFDRLRRKGWHVAWLYGRSDRTSGLHVMIAARP